MITQYDHILQSSFYLWFEFQLGVCGGAYKKNVPINFYTGGQGPLEGNDELFAPDVPEGMVAYNSPYRQFLGIEDSILDPDVSTFCGPSSGLCRRRMAKAIKINGNSVQEFPDAPSSAEQVILDYKNGRVLLDESAYNHPVSVTGNFNLKTFNTYFSSEDEESLLVNSDFLIKNDSLKTFLESKLRFKEKTYTVPAAFVTTSRSENKPFAMGGLDSTVSTITTVVVANTNYELDFALSLFRDSARQQFALIPFEKFPYGEFFSIKPENKRYKYKDLAEAYSEKAFIENVTVSKLSDKASKNISKDLKIGFIDFEVSSVRMPRCICDYDPAPTPSESQTPSPSNTPSPSITLTQTGSPTSSISPPPPPPTSSATPSILPPPPSPTSSATPSASATESPSASATESPSASATESPSASATESPSASATESPSASATESLKGDIFERCVDLGDVFERCSNGDIFQSCEPSQ